MENYLAVNTPEEHQIFEYISELVYIEIEWDWMQNMAEDKFRHIMNDKLRKFTAKAIKFFKEKSAEDTKRNNKESLNSEKTGNVEQLDVYHSDYKYDKEILLSCDIRATESSDYEDYIEGNRRYYAPSNYHFLVLDIYNDESVSEYPEIVVEIKNIRDKITHCIEIPAEELKKNTFMLSRIFGINKLLPEGYERRKNEFLDLEISINELYSSDILATKTARIPFTESMAESVGDLKAVIVPNKLYKDIGTAINYRSESSCILNSDKLEIVSVVINLRTEIELDLNDQFSYAKFNLYSVEENIWIDYRYAEIKMIEKGKYSFAASFRANYEEYEWEAGEYELRLSLFDEECARVLFSVAEEGEGRGFPYAEIIWEESVSSPEKEPEESGTSSPEEDNLVENGIDEVDDEITGTDDESDDVEIDYDENNGFDSAGADNDEEDNGEDEFDRLLNSFITEQLNDFKIERIAFRTGKYIIMDPVEEQLSPFYPQENNGGYFFMEYPVCKSYPNLKLKIKSSKDEEISVKISASELEKGNGKIHFVCKMENLFKSYTGRSIESVKIKIYDDATKDLYITKEVNLPCIGNILELFVPEKISFFNNDKNESLSLSENSPLMIFSQKSLENLTIFAAFKATEGLDYLELPDLGISLYDQTGRLVDHTEASIMSTNSNDNVIYVNESFGERFDYKWEKGRYRLEFSIFSEPFASLSFEVADRELTGEPDLGQLINSIRKKGDSSQKNVKREENAMDMLDSMIGLASVKEKIHLFSKMSNLNKKRAELGLPVSNMPLHAQFLGNPGTGKTTVAEILGKIYKELGLLSKGHVVKTEKKNLVGRFYDSEFRAIEQALEDAKGGILFIDEAYNLYVKDDPKNPGNSVIDALITALSDENNRDWMLILAGYPDKMTELISSNQGLASRVDEKFIFEDYNVDELIAIAGHFCNKNQYELTDEAWSHLRSVVSRAYAARDEEFGNGRYVINLIQRQVLANMAHRLSGIENPSADDLRRITAADIPSISKTKSSKGIESLENMVGLENLKTSITKHLNFVKMKNRRMQLGLDTEMPPLHMIFSGNPGTGKTTVADFMGEIYASMGILSQGSVIRCEKSDLIGNHLGDTELKMRTILKRAKGNILFIDEAYQLNSVEGGGRDYGIDAINTLLTALSKESPDLIVILAGYADEMEKLLDSNKGLRSRFPYTFTFEDYSVDELVKIACQRVEKNNFTFSPAAVKRLKSLVKLELKRKKSNFGNARFITRLISSQILPNMATRVGKLENPTIKQLKMITAADIPITDKEIRQAEYGLFNNEELNKALEKLDSLVGLEKVKAAIHNFVDIAKYQSSIGENFVGKGILKWNFSGNTGTGKSTVARIFTEILNAMNLLEKGNFVEVKGEQIYNVPEHICDEVLRSAMEKSRYGLLFIDGDAPEFRNNQYKMSNEQLRIKLTSLTAETGGVGAIIIAECSSPRHSMANTLAINGIYDFDHTFVFDDYTEEELFEILLKCLSKHKVKFTPEAEQIIRKYINDLCLNRELSFANARTMKLLSRTIYDAMLLRESKEKKSPRRRVIKEDVESFVWKRTHDRIGYKP